MRRVSLLVSGRVPPDHSERSPVRAIAALGINRSPRLGDARDDLGSRAHYEFADSAVTFRAGEWGDRRLQRADL